MNKKVFSLLMLAIMFILILSTVSLGAETITLRWQSPHHSEPQIISLRDRLIKEFEEANPDIKIEKLIYPRTDLWTKFVLAAQAGQTPDIYDMSYNYITQAVDQGWVKSLDEFISPEDLEFPLKNQIERSTFDGKLYAWPFWGSAYAAFYNVRMLREAGLDETKLPQTWDEYLEWVKILTKDTNGDGIIDQYGMGDVLGSTSTCFSHHMLYVWTHGGDFLDKDMTKCLLDSPEAISALKFRTEMSTKHGVLPPGPIGYEYVEMTNAFAFEKIATMISANWAIGKIETDNPDIEGQYVIGPIPRGVESATLAGGNSMTIGRDCEYPEAAWKFIKFMASKENSVQRGLTAAWLPLRSDAIQDERIINSKIGPFAELLPVGRSMPATPAFAEIQDIAINMIHEVLLGNKTPEEASKDTTSEINSILDTY